MEASVNGVVKVSLVLDLTRACGCIEHYDELGSWHRDPWRRLQATVARRLQDRSLRSNDKTNARPYRVTTCSRHRLDPYCMWRTARDEVKRARLAGEI